MASGDQTGSASDDQIRSWTPLWDGAGEGVRGRSRVAEIQRARLLRAALEAIDEHGYGGFTVAHVIERAKVSRKTFYEVFDDREECFVELFERGLAQAEQRVSAAYREQPSWREGVRAGLAELLALIDEQSALARLCVVDALAASPRILRRRQQVLERLRAVVELGRSQSDGRRGPAEVAAEGAIGAVFAVLHTRLLERSRKPYAGLVGQLTSMLVLPYLGAAAARRELERPLPARRRRAPAARRSAARAGDDLLAATGMRLTYRTVMVLKAIAEKRGASNREVADAAGISDQGQMSKLLARLERLELVENIGDGLPRGAPNRWRLSERGAQVERSTHGL